jgi:hypothetical protein
MLFGLPCSMTELVLPVLYSCIAELVSPITYSLMHSHPPL